MSRFAKKWEKTEARSLKETFKERIEGQEPLKLRLEQASRQIQAQIAKLDSALTRLREKDSSIFNKAVSALQKHDTQAACVLSNELAEVRKMNKMITQARFALEQIVLRLNTIQELGDVVVTLAPAVTVIRSVKSGLVNFLPEAEHEIGEISNLLGSILVDAGQLGGYTLNFATANEDAEKILLEASAVAEQMMKEKFPDLPASATESKQIERSGQTG